MNCRWCDRDFVYSEALYAHAQHVHPEEFRTATSRPTTPEGGRQDPVGPADILMAAADYRAAAEDLDGRSERVPYDRDHWLSREIEAVERAERHFGAVLSRYIRQEIRNYLHAAEED